MAVRKVYVESSVLGVTLHPAPSPRRRAARALLRRMQQRELEGYISRVTLEEMEKAPTHTFLRLQRVVRQARLKVVAASDESNAIAQLYIDGGIIPSNYDNDARHIAPSHRPRRSDDRCERGQHGTGLPTDRHLHA